MKSLISILALVVISIVFNSCGKDSSFSTNSKVSETTTALLPVVPKVDTTWKTPSKFSVQELVKKVYTEFEYDGANAEYASFVVIFEVDGKSLKTEYLCIQSGHSNDPEPFTAIAEATKTRDCLIKKKASDFEIQYVSGRPILFQTKEVWIEGVDGLASKYEAPVIIEKR